MKKIKSILYVEDEKAIQVELAQELEEYCDTLYVADDGIQGLELFQHHMPQIVITDIKMPFMDGIQMCKKIKEINEDTHIVFTTAFSDTDFFQEAIELQVDGYIIKPIDLDLLDKKIISIIKQISLQDELTQKEQMLIQQSKLAAMGEMIGNIAHQWRQPLGVISVTASGIMVEYEFGNTVSEENMIQSMKNIINNTNYLSDTIDDFRNFFRPSNLKNKYNLKEFLDRCINLVRASFDENVIETIENIDSKINSYGDPNQLSQAIINILNNAKDALKEARGIQKKLVFVLSAIEDQDNVVITIKDNAGGIPENIINRVFEPYFTTKHKSRGTGLGLYITHTIITKNLKGSITVSNSIFEYEGESYKGAEFVIRLPVKIDQ